MVRLTGSHVIARYTTQAGWDGRARRGSWLQGNRTVVPGALDEYQRDGERDDSRGGGERHRPAAPAARHLTAAPTGRWPGWQAQGRRGLDLPGGQVRVRGS